MGGAASAAPAHVSCMARARSSALRIPPRLPCLRSRADGALALNGGRRHWTPLWRMWPPCWVQPLSRGLRHRLQLLQPVAHQLQLQPCFAHSAAAHGTRLFGPQEPAERGTGDGAWHSMRALELLVHQLIALGLEAGRQPPAAVVFGQDCRERGVGCGGRGGSPLPAKASPAQRAGACAGLGGPGLAAWRKWPPLSQQHPHQTRHG